MKEAWQQNSSQRMVERGLWIYLLTIGVFTAIVWLPFLLHGHPREEFPLGSFSERFGDLTHFASEPQKLSNPNLEDWNHLAGLMFPRSYGPLAVLTYLFLLKVCSPYGVVVFLLAVFGSLAIACLRLWWLARRAAGYRPLVALAIFGTGLLCYPTAQAALRGNIEGVVWIGYAAGVGLMCSRRWGRSATVLGVFSCIKPYPMLLLSVLVFRRKYKAAASGVLTLLLVTLACLTFLGNGSPQRGKARISEHFDTFFEDYVTGYRPAGEAAGDHSLLETAKSITRIIKSRGLPLREQELQSLRAPRSGRVLVMLYVPFAGLSMAWILWRIRTQPFLNQVFSLCICLTLFPFIAADYTLTILYVPMALFLLFLLREVAPGRVALSETRLVTILVACALMMVPLPMLGLWSGDARSMILLSLLLVVMGTPMPTAMDAEERFGSGVRLVRVPGGSVGEASSILKT